MTNKVSPSSASESGWLNSSDARKRAKVSTCELAHLRQQGEIRAIQKGRAFFYAKSDCEKVERTKKPQLRD